MTGNYWNFPTGTDSFALSSNDLVDPDPGHHATYRIASDFTVGAPYWRTEVGAHENSASPYGTFDQGGNVMEFTETVGMLSETRRMRGGSWNMGGTTFFVSEIDDVMHSSDQFADLGFRLVTLAEPSQPPPVPALSAPRLLAVVLGVGGAIALARARRGSRLASTG